SGARIDDAGGNGQPDPAPHVDSSSARHYILRRSGFTPGLVTPGSPTVFAARSAFFLVRQSLGTGLQPGRTDRLSGGRKSERAAHTAPAAKATTRPPISHAAMKPLPGPSSPARCR